MAPSPRPPRPAAPKVSAGRTRLALVIAALSVLALIQPADRAGAQGNGERLTSRPRPAAPKAAALAVGEEVRTAAGERRRLVLPDASVLYVNAGTRARLDAARRLTLVAGEVYVEVAPGQAMPFVVKTPRREVTGRATHFAVRAAPAGTAVVVARGHVDVTGLQKPVRAGQQLAADADKPAPGPRASHALGWTRELLAAADSPLVPSSKHAGGALIARDPNGQEAKLSLRRFHIDVHIEDGFARTTIDQTYFNDSPFQLEGTFYFPLPPDASLSRLAMYVATDGGVCQLMEGGMVEADLGRRVYETIRHANRDPALLEWLDGSTFKMRVFPLEGRQEKRIVLSYTQRLPVLYDEVGYRFPAGHNLQQVRDWSFRARVQGGAALPWSSASHTLQASTEGKDLLLTASAKDARTDRDVVLSLHDARPGAEGAARFSAAEHEKARYLMLRYRPALVGEAQARRRDWVFLFESSGDRDPLLARAQIEVVRHLLSKAEPGDTFNVLTAGTRVRPFGKEARPVTSENVQAALAFLEQSHLIGALDLGKALAEAGALLKESARPCLVHVGSGIPAMGERRLDVLAQSIPAAAEYVGVGVGRRWNRALMKLAAERAGGLFTQVNPDEPIAWRAFELSATLNAPRLQRVTAADAATGKALLCYGTELAQGEELCALTRAGPGEELPRAVKVRGTLGGRPFEHVLPVGELAGRAGYLPRTWAKLEIDWLLTEDAAKHREQIVALSKAMYVMTPFTSLLVLENEDLYTQHKVDRGRKDHWALYPAPDKIPLVYEPDPSQPDPKLLNSGVKLPTREALRTIVVRRSPSLLAKQPLFRGAGEEWRQKSSIAFPEVGFLGGEKGQPPTNLPAPFGLDGKAREVEGKQVYNFYIGASRDVGSAGTSAVFPGMPLAGTFYGRSGVPQEKRRKEDPLVIADVDPAAAEPDTQINYRVTLKGQVSVPGILNPDEPVGILNGRRRRVFDATSVYRPDPARSALGIPRAPMGINAFANQLLGGSNQAAPLLYERPSYQDDPRHFADLLAYAPGMNTSLADIEAVLEAEAIPDPADRPGKIDDAARTLIGKARSRGWHAWKSGNEKPLTIFFDGLGRYAYERVLPLGLRERVVCDGNSLLHVYPQLGLAARRAVSRFHRADFADLVPWCVPPAADLARGADLKLVGERTVAIVPHGAATAKGKDGKPAVYDRVHLVFDEDGWLAERQVVRMPKGEILLRRACTTDGTLRLFDGKGKALFAWKGTLAPCQAPDLAPDTKDLVVLSLPYRTREHVQRTLKIEQKGNAELRFADALQLLAADVAQGNTAQAQAVFSQALHARNQRQLGLYVLLAACGANLDAQNVDVLSEHLDDPVAQYLALHSSPVLRKHASQWAVSSASWGEGLLHHLAVTHALCQRWQTDKVLKGGLIRTRAEVKRALEYVRRHKGTAWGWALLGLMQDRAGKDKGLHSALAECWLLFEGVPGLRYAAHYEHARSLWKAGKADEARDRFTRLHADTVKDGLLPAIDADFRRALLGATPKADRWGELLRATATGLIERKQRPAVLALAWQCWQLDDPPLANHLLGTALADIKDKKERVAMKLAGLQFLWQTAQWPQADDLLRELLADAETGKHAALWRLAADLAGKRDMTARALECLEKALDLEFAKLPEVIDLAAVRRDYGQLLGHYQGLADAMVTLKVRPPSDFLARAVRAADRWRALDRDAGEACRLVARILQRLGERDLGWDYLTTPVGMQPNESGPWAELAQALRQRGDLELADRAYEAAFGSEPTNAQVLWDRAQNLRQAGRSVEAQRLFRRLAEGSWQPRFQGLQAQARLLAPGG